jgi:hypothetical protein
MKRAMAAILLVVALGAAAHARDALPEGPGLAAKYPLDKGIGRDTAVLFAEDFEAGTIGDLRKRWSNVKDKGALAFDAEPAGGRRCLRITATPGRNQGGHLYKQFRGVDRAFARFYVRFPKKADYIHHFVHLGGYRPATRWPQGGAGIRPKGDDRMTVGIEPHGKGGRLPAPGAWTFYTYWHEMKKSADGKFWGNGLSPVEPAVVPRGRWQCVEVMMTCNSAPDQPDGELALWLDGKLVAHFHKGARRGRWTGMGFKLLEHGGTPFEGFRWRTDGKLKINFFWLLHYVTPHAARHNRAEPPTRPNRVWFDNIVVATEYVGPIQQEPQQGAGE